MRHFANNADYYDALRRITMYDRPGRLRKRAEKDYGLSGDEAIEMAYEMVSQDLLARIRESLALSEGMRNLLSPAPSAAT